VIIVKNIERERMGEIFIGFQAKVVQMSTVEQGESSLIE
jgi:hypothetical protein